MPTILTARLPVRFDDSLTIEADHDAAGQILTPAQAIALGEQLIRQGIHRQAALRQARAAVPMLQQAKVVA